MNSPLRVFLVSLAMWWAGCAVFEAKEATYLRSAQDRATQEEIRQQLGPPAISASDREGQSVWVYQVRGQQPGNRMSPTGSWCDEYVLTFDGRRVLRRWTHRSYFHGGELMPTYCVPDGFEGKS